MNQVVITTNRLDFGGAERQRVILANGLAQRGNAVELRLLQAGGPLESLVDPRVRVRLLPHYWSLTCSRGRRVLITGTTRTETWYGLVSVLLSLGRVRWVVAVHNPIPPNARLFSRGRAAMVNRAHAVVHLSKGQEKALAQNSGVRGRRAAIIPNGVDVTALLDGYDRSPRPPGPPVLLFLGRLSAQKGLDVLFEGLSACVDLDWHLCIAGDGPERESLQADVGRRPYADRVQWLGAVPTVRALELADALVLPSRNEAHPLVLLEGAVVGLPVIATAVGAVPDIMERAIGLTCPPADPAALAAILRQLLGSLATYQMEARARLAELAEQFSERRMVDDYDGLITSLR